ncbi:uncharacterized protein LOC120370200 [Mauremys reevesii]|uniref:uncharacterized protein LOC120370200 n=1 Tax=Mauremys reevesii TaxID=260615 RepID=UPI00193EFA50|nr:uncharacterized protein LOC120370200 [Mauremys reevesii]
MGDPNILGGHHTNKEKAGAPSCTDADSRSSQNYKIKEGSQIGKPEFPYGKTPAGTLPLLMINWQGSHQTLRISLRIIRKRENTESSGTAASPTKIKTTQLHYKIPAENKAKTAFCIDLIPIKSDQITEQGSLHRHVFPSRSGCSPRLIPPVMLIRSESTENIKIYKDLIPWSFLKPNSSCAEWEFCSTVPNPGLGSHSDRRCTNK